MFDGRHTKTVFALLAIIWVVLVGRAYLNVKGPEDFVVTVTQEEVEAFARHQLNALQARSFAENVELCAIIFEDSEGNLGTTPLKVGAEASCDIAYFDEPGMAPLASLHTHGSHGEQYDSEVPSITDMESDIANQMDGYISTPGGRFWRVDWQNERAVLVCGAGCLQQDRAYRPCAGDVLTREFTLGQLVARSRGPGPAC